MAQRLEIVNGPSKFDLMMSLFHGKSAEQLRQVQFDVTRATGRVSRAIIIDGVQREDGSAESWLIDGRIIIGELLPFKGYYSTRTRTGFMEVVE